MTDTEKFDKIVSKMADILYTYDEKERKEMLEGAILEAWKPELKDNQLRELTEGFSRLVTERLDGKRFHVAALEKFQELPHINSSYEILDDWGYTPNLYHFDGMWHVSWIHCSEGDDLVGFSGNTPEEAINKAYEWFHNKFKND